MDNRLTYLLTIVIVLVSTFLLHNGKFWTRSKINTWMVVSSDIITEIGSGDIPEEFVNIDKIDLDGSVVLPGLQDAHIHVYGLGRSVYRLQLEKPRSIAEMQNKLIEYVKTRKTDKSQWIIGHNWDQDYMEDQRYPDKHDLDLIEKDRPVLLFRACNHIAVVNSKALEILKISMSTVNPDGGTIDRDERGGATGILRESALGLVTKHIQITDPAVRKSILLRGLQECLEVGLTTVQTNDPNCWGLYEELFEEGLLPIRVYMTAYYKEIGKVDLPVPDYRNNLLNMGRIKFFTDGSLGAQTAALKEPYSDTGKLGITIQTQEELNVNIKQAHDLGYQLEVHAIGDLAAERTIEAFDFVGVQEKDRALLTHCQVLSKSLIEQMKNMGVIANIQPPFVTTDSQWVEKRLGKGERYDYAYAWNTLIAHGLHVSGGSDSPIESPNPFSGLHAAIFRHNPKGETWKENECLTFDDAVEIYTNSAAYAIFGEDKLGKLEAGYKADFVIIKEDIIADNTLLVNVKPQQVWIDGKQKL